jgi:hypothetical protein
VFLGLDAGRGGCGEEGQGQRVRLESHEKHFTAMGGMLALPKAAGEYMREFHSYFTCRP